MQVLEAERAESSALDDEVLRLEDDLSAVTSELDVLQQASSGVSTDALDILAALRCDWRKRCRSGTCQCAQPLEEITTVHAAMRVTVKEIDEFLVHAVCSSSVQPHVTLNMPKRQQNDNEVPPLNCGGIRHGRRHRR